MTRVTRRGRRARVLVALLACPALAAGCALPWRSDRDASGMHPGAAATVTPPDSADGSGPDAVLDAEAQAETAAAVDRLEQMADWLGARRSFRFRADVSYDAVQTSGERIEFGGGREIVVERPDRLRVDLVDRDGDREIIAYDGQEVWLASPSLRAFARMPHAGSVETVIERLAEADVPLPLADLIDPGLGARLRPEIVSASRVGLVRLDGRLCEQLAYRTALIDFQLFVEPGDAPIPRRIVIDYRDEPGRPQFRASLRDWDLSGRARSADFFRITPPIGAQRLGIGELVELMREDDGESGPEGGSR